jgi:hypothetical protein
LGSVGGLPVDIGCSTAPSRAGWRTRPHTLIDWHNTHTSYKTRQRRRRHSTDSRSLPHKSCSPCRMFSRRDSPDLGGTITSPAHVQTREPRHSLGPGIVGNWAVASAAKHIFGRGRSISAPNSPRTRSPETRGMSPTASVTSIPIGNSSFLSYSPRPSSRGSNTGGNNIPTTGVLKQLAKARDLTVSLHLTEPVVYVTGFEPSEYESRPPTILRGSLILQLTKPTKMKSIRLSFVGSAQVHWIHLDAPQQTRTAVDNTTLVEHTWQFFDARCPNAEVSHGADVSRIMDQVSRRPSVESTRSSMESVSTAVSEAPSRGTMSPCQGTEGSVLEGVPEGPSASVLALTRSSQAKGYRHFSPGEYMCQPPPLVRSNIVTTLSNQ